MSKQNIIDKIISDAEAKRDALLTEANDQATIMIAEANDDCRIKKMQAENEASTALPELKRRAISVAELEVKKLALSARQQTLGKAFDAALDKLCKLPDAEYLSLVADMIAAVAEDGDVVVASKADKSRITNDFVQSIAKKKGVKLTLSSKYGDFKGGVVLQSDGCDKNMTFEVELAALREELEPKISAKLF